MDEFKPCECCKLAFAQLEARLEDEQRSSRVDTLTGLPNLLAFRERFLYELAQVRRHHWPLVVLMADLDDFKTVNDTFGHPVGDKVLIQFGRLLREAFPRETDFHARRSGDEFYAILPSTSHSQAARLAVRFRERVRESLVVTVGENLYAKTTASVGFEEFHEGEDPSDFLKRVDGSLYRAKRGEGPGDQLFGD